MTTTVTLLLAGCAPPAEISSAPGAVSVWLVEASESWGLDFHHSAVADADYATPDIIGSGGALFDYDHDGDLDLYLVDAGKSDGSRINRMFRHDAPGRLVEVTSTSGAADGGYGMGAAVGDIDNDGDEDLVTTNLGPDVLFMNRGDGSFGPATEKNGLGIDLWSTSACLLDYNRDGDLDLYVTTYLDFEPGKSCTDNAGNREFCGPAAFGGVGDLLYRGDGTGRFVDVSERALRGRPLNKGLGVVCADLDGDGWTDVYVANDGERNQLWVNRGDGSFEDRALLLGAALNLLGRPEASMGVAAGDFDGDLDLDLFMTHLDRETNTLYRNLGEAGFEDGTPASGLGPASMPYTGFGTAFFDVDLDGDLDLASVNGRVRRGTSLTDRAERRDAWTRAESLPPTLAPYAEPDVLFLNRGDGRFLLAGDDAGWNLRPVAVSRSLLVGDLEGDGDPDLVVTRCGGRAELFENRFPDPGGWLAVETIGSQNRAALGAILRLFAGDLRLAQPVSSTYGYLSAGRSRVLFGLGDAATVQRLEIDWPDGTRSALHDLPRDRTIHLYQRSGGAFR